MGQQKSYTKFYFILNGISTALAKGMHVAIIKREQ
jgi:hypothetical protein